MATPTNQSVIKAFAILQSFDTPDEWLTSAELSRRAGLPEASGYRLIQTLEQIGAVVRDSRGRYRPRLRLAAASSDALFGKLLGDISRSVLGELAQRLNATVHVGVLEDWMVTYVAKAAAPSAVQVPTRVGAQLEAYCSALGKMLLACVRDEEFERFLQQGELIALTDNTITDRNAFRREIAEIRQRGFAWDDREAYPDLSCIAVPIRNRGGMTMAAISVTDRWSHFDERRKAEASAALTQAASQIGRKLFSWNAMRDLQHDTARGAPKAPVPLAGFATTSAGAVL